jgi:flagellar motor switch protein FliG
MSALAIARPRGSDGLARSARLMRALGPEAAPVWNELSPQEARALSAAMDALDDDLRDESETLESYKQAYARGGAPGASDAPVWAQVSGLETRDLLQLAEGQHPQALALMISRLDGKASARVLKAIEKSVAVEVMQRLLHLGPIHPSAMVALETSVSAWMANAAPAARTGGHEGVARIFDRMDSRSEQSLLSALESAVPGAGARVRSLMFTFDDLAHLDAGGLQTLLSAADRTRLTFALKGAREETAAAFFRNMTQRAGELLREEIDMLGAVRRSEIEAARMELVDLARTLIERGDIRAGRPHDEDELIE